VSDDRVQCIDVYTSDDYQAYCLFEVDLGEDKDTVMIAAAVGVPDHLISTAKAAGGITEGLYDAWCVDSSDWANLTEEQRDEALAVLADVGAQLTDDWGWLS